MIRIVDRVMMDVIQVPRVRKYQLPGGTKVIEEYDMYPPQEPTPSNPYVQLQTSTLFPFIRLMQL